MPTLTAQIDENVQTLHKKGFELKDCNQIHGVQQESACQTLAIVDYGSKQKKKEGRKSIQKTTSSAGTGDQ